MLLGIVAGDSAYSIHTTDELIAVQIYSRNVTGLRLLEKDQKMYSVDDHGVGVYAVTTRPG